MRTVSRGFLLAAGLLLPAVSWGQFVPPASPPSTAAPVAAPAAAAAAGPEAAVEGEMKVARAEPVAERDVTTRTQIFLDQQLFSPGKIDGRPGEFLTKALKRYQLAHGLPQTGVVDANI